MIYKNKSILSTLFFAFIVISFIQAQDVKLVNGGFEDRPRHGDQFAYDPIKGWFDCGAIDFPSESPPDIHQGINRDTSFWGNEQPSAKGKTYLGMVVRESESYESLSQRLAMPLKAGKCYQFSIFLSQSQNYVSALANNQRVEKNFTQPTVFRLWGGEGLCAESELLATSEPINHSEWREYAFKIEPSRSYRYIRIEAFWETPVLLPYNGHILLDGASDFELIPCEEEVAMYVANEVEKKPKNTKRMPAHKARKKKQVVFEKGSNEVKVDTVVYKKPQAEKILSLDRNSIKAGQNIRIDQLFFEADTSAINTESFNVLNEVFDFLNTNLDIEVEIQGHTNNIPPHKYCDTLSTQRAKAVAEYLIEKGIQEERIRFKGWGKRRPIYSNGTPEGRRKNQRVEIKIIKIG